MAMGKFRILERIIASHPFRYALLIFIFALVGCASKSCRETKNSNQQKSVIVYKYDETLQCGMGQEVSLDQMEKELVGIKVLSKQKKRDGLMRTAVCGSGTGQANVYEIPETQLGKAKELGFKIWNF